MSACFRLRLASDNESFNFLSRLWRRMRKLVLDVENLRVESFVTSLPATPRGTVAAFSEGDTLTGWQLPPGPVWSDNPPCKIVSDAVCLPENNDN